MPRTPSLEQIQGFAAAYFTDHDPIRAESAASSAASPQGWPPRIRAHRHVIFDEALQLDRVLEQDNAVASSGDLVKQGVGERGLAGAGAAGNQYVAALVNRFSKECSFVRRHRTLLNVGREADGRDGTLANSEDR